MASLPILFQENTSAQSKRDSKFDAKEAPKREKISKSNQMTYKWKRDARFRPQLTKTYERLRAAWRTFDTAYPFIEVCVGHRRADEIDPFDKPQLETVLRVCSEFRSIGAAGRG